MPHCVLCCAFKWMTFTFHFFHLTDRLRDYEGFVSSLLLPEVARRSSLALRAFNVELSQAGIYNN